MAAITALTENFTGGSSGANIALSPTTIFDTNTGAGTPSTRGTLGSYNAMVNAPGATDFALYRADFTAGATTWLGMYFSLETTPTAATAVISFFSGTTKIGDVRFSNSTIQLRNNSSAVWTSSTLATGVKHRLALQIAPTAGGTGTIRLKIYSGGNVDSSTPSQDSGAQNSTVAVASCDNIRIGTSSADATLVWKAARIRADNATEDVALRESAAPTTPITALTENFTAGTEGQDITSANSIFDSFDSPGNGLYVSSDSVGRAMLVNPASASSSYARADFPANATVWFEFFIEVWLLPTQPIPIVSFWTGTTKAAELRITAAGVLQLCDSGIGAGAVLWASTAIGVGLRHRVAFRVTAAGGATSSVQLKTYEGSDQFATTPTQNSGSQTLTIAASTVDNVRVGSGAIGDIGYRIAQLRGDSSVEPYLAGGASNAAPTANAGPDQSGITPGATVTLNGSGSTDPDGSISSYAWTQTSGTSVTLSGSGANRTFTAPTTTFGTTLTFSLQVTDNGGVTSTADTVSIQINGTSETGTISALFEDFGGATSGTIISTANTIFDSITGGGTESTFGTSFGVPCMVNAPGATDFRLYRADFTASSLLWFSCYFTITAVPTTSSALIAVYSGTTKIADVRVLAGTSTIQLRSVNTERWTSTAVTVGIRHRLALQVAPTSGGTGTLRLRLYTGPNKHSTTPSQDSGLQAAAALAASSDNVRIGTFGADATLAWRASHLRGNSVAEPAPIVDGNGIPVANAGPDQASVPGGSTVTLTGAGSSDPDGTIASYAWSQLSGPAVTLSGSGATRTFTAPGSASTLVFQLIVTDNVGEVSNPDTVQIAVASSNQAPIANAGPDQTVDGYQTVTLNGIASADPDGTITAYSWLQTAGTTVTLSGTGATRTFTAPAVMTSETLTFRLIVTDNNSSASPQDTVSINVNAWDMWIKSGSSWIPRRLAQFRVGNTWT